MRISIRRARQVTTLFVAASLCGCLAARPQGHVAPGTGPFEEEIAAYQSADRVYPQPGGSVVFVGGAAIRRWEDLDDAMAGYRVLNRGFGGARYADILAAVDRVIAPYAPSAVVLYAGDEDLVGEDAKSPEQVVADLRRVIGRIGVRCPGARVVVVSIAPFPARIAAWPLMQRTNELIAALVAGRKDRVYADVATPMLDADGKPRAALYSDDGLELSDAGYAVWARVIREALSDALPAP